MEYLDMLVNKMNQINRTFDHKRELFIGNGTKMSAISVGNALTNIGNNNTNKEKKFLLKKIPLHEDINLETYFLKSLWMMEYLYNQELKNEFDKQLPSILGIQYHSKNIPNAIIMEDYTQRNKLLTYSLIISDELHPSSMDVVKIKNNDYLELLHLGARFGSNPGEIKIIDFDTYASPNLDKYEKYLKLLKFEPNN